MTSTLEKWKAFMERTGNKNIADYLLIGDIVTEDLIHHIRIHMPLKTDKYNYLQLDGIQYYSYDISRALRPVYSTFAECDGIWRYYGCCFPYETIDRS